MVARAALSQVNPCLLADVRPSSDETAANLFFACGIRVGDKPAISIAASTVFKRCRVLMPDFTDAEVKWCIDFASKRNEELHAGSSPYSTFTAERWLTDYYRIMKILLLFLGLDLSYMFGTETATVAESMVAAQSAHIKKQTLDSIQSARVVLLGLTPEEIANRAARTGLSDRNSKRVTCPTGSHECVITGETTHVSAPRLDEDGDIVVTRTIIPTNLVCLVCGLRLETHPALIEAGVGTPFTKFSVEDPIEFHGIEIMDHVSEEDMQNYIASQFEPEYGND